MAYDRMNVPLSGYTSMTDRFRTHVRHIDGGALNNPSLEMEWTEFVALFKATVASGDGLAVKIHFGLLDHNLIFGISQVYMKNDGAGGYDLSVLDYNLVTAGKLASSSEAVIDALVDTYLDNVEVKRTDSGGFTPLVKGTDPNASIMPYELELKMLIDQNMQSHGGSMADYTVVINSLFDTEASGGDFIHGIGISLKKGSAVLLTDALSTSAPMLDKMADMMNPCPPRCKKYVKPSPTPE